MEADCNIVPLPLIKERPLFRGIKRTDTSYICWFQVMVQGLALIPFPAVLTDFTSTHNDAVSQLFHFISELQRPTSQPISARRCQRVASNFVTFLNNKYHVQWDVRDQQDVVSAMEFVLNSICDFTGPISSRTTIYGPISSETSSTIRSADAALRRFMNSKFLLRQCERVFCPHRSTWYKRNDETGYVLQVGVPPNKKQIVTLQSVLDTHFSAEILGNNYCSLCDGDHGHAWTCIERNVGGHECNCHDRLTQKRLELVRAPEMLFVQLKRYTYDFARQSADYFGDKNTVKVALSNVILRDSHGAQEYEAVWVPVHYGTAVNSGHYASERLKHCGPRTRIVNTNDETLTYPHIPQFDQANSSMVLLQRVGGVPSQRPAIHGLSPPSIASVSEPSKPQHPSTIRFPEQIVPPRPLPVTLNLPNFSEVRVRSSLPRLSPSARRRARRDKQRNRSRVYSAPSVTNSVSQSVIHPISVLPQPTLITQPTLIRPVAPSMCSVEQRARFAVYDAADPPLHDSGYSKTKLGKKLHLGREKAVKFFDCLRGRTAPVSPDQLRDDLLVANISLKQVKASWLGFYYFGTQFLKIITSDFEFKFDVEKSRRERQAANAKSRADAVRKSQEYLSRKERRTDEQKQMESATQHEAYLRRAERRTDEQKQTDSATQREAYLIRKEARTDIQHGDELFRRRVRHREQNETDPDASSDDQNVSDPDGSIVEPPKKKQKKTEKLKLSARLQREREAYLAEMDSAKNGELHDQEFAKELLKDWSPILDDFILVHCRVCKERWWGKVNQEDICERCKREATRLKKNPESDQVPRYGKDNDMDPGIPPEWARGLTQIEEMLVSPIVTVMSVYTVRGGSVRHKGNCINFPQNTQSLATTLPRLVSELDVLVLHPPDRSPTERTFQVSRRRIARFLRMAVATNMAGYQDIEISDENIRRLPEGEVPRDLPSCPVDLASEALAHGPMQQESAEVPLSDDMVETDAQSETDEPETFANCGIQVQMDKGAETDEIRRTLEQCAQDEDDEAQDDELRWQTQSSQPANEFTTVALAAKVFPTLFANRCAILDSPRVKEVTFKQWVRHLLKFAYWDSQRKLWVAPYAEHPRFVFWCLNMWQRKRSMQMSDLILKKNADDRSLTIEEIQKQLNNSNKTPAFVKRFQRYAQGITGSSSYWFKHSQQLGCLLEQKGPATLFITYSYADLYWPELHRLLGVANATRAQKRKAINDNPHIVASFFIHRVKWWNKLFLKGILDEVWEWLRYENQGRGTIHAHMMSKLKHDPGLINLCKIAHQGQLAEETLVGDFLEEDDANRLSEDDRLEAEQKMAEGKAAEERVCAYCDTLISGVNPMEVDDRQQFRAARGDDHACAKTVDPTMTAEQLDADYANILNSVQIHKCNLSCQRKRRGRDGKEELVCRFKAPWEQVEKTYLSFEVKKDGHVTCSINIKRNDERVNKHNRIKLQYWRANVDMQIILDWRACYNYISKYAAKANKTSEPINEALSKIADRLGASEDVTKFFRKAMIATLGQTDKSHQEAIQLMLADEMNMVQHEKFTFVSCNLTNDIYIRLETQPDGSKRARATKSDLDKYADRCDKLDVNFHDWLKERKSTSKKEAIISYFPKYSSNPKKESFSKFCKLELIKYKPWTGEASNTWCDEIRDPTDESEDVPVDEDEQNDGREDRQEDHDSTDESEDVSVDEDAARVRESRMVVEAYMDFMRSDWAQEHLPETVLEAAKHAEITLEQDEFEAMEQSEPQAQREAWQLICDQMEREEQKIAMDTDFDWSTDARKYADHVEGMMDQIQRLKELETDEVVLKPPEISKFTDGQRRAYQIITRHFNDTSPNKQQLLIGVFGTAGTGKSYLIDALHYALRTGLTDHCRICATTGLAAHNIHGRTVHSDLSLPIMKPQKRDLKGNSLTELQKRLDPDVVRYIVIDEISMCSQEDFKWMDNRLREASGRKSEAFGGYNLIIVGDHGQLPPVCATPLWRKPSRKADPHGHVLYKMFRDIVLLEKVKRQSGVSAEDDAFRTLLSHLRDGQVTKKDWELLMTRTPQKVGDRVLNTEFKDAPRVFTTNKKCANFNVEKLKSLQIPISKIEAIHDPAAAKAEDPKNAMGLHPVLYLAVGARVMCTSNLCQRKGLTNGAFGTVKAIIYKPGFGPPSVPIAVVVKFDDFKGDSCLPDMENCVAIRPITATWYKGGRRYSRTQLPLKLAWAITVHKSQGQTMAKLVIDISNPHAPGLEFVAISRVRRLSDLVIHGVTWTKFKQLNNKETIKMRRKEDARLKTLYMNLIAALEGAPEALAAPSDRTM